MNKHRKRSNASAIFDSFQQNETILKKFLRRFMSNKQDIEDICQETILRALEAEKSREIQEPRAFLFGVSKNIIRKQLDRQSKSLIDLIEDFTPQEYLTCNKPSVEDSVDDQQRMIFFSEAVATLPQQCQRVFMMKKAYGYSHKEISSQLGISTSTVEKHVAAGLRRCKEYMQKNTQSRIPATVKIQNKI